MRSPDPRALRNMARSPVAGTWFRIENRAEDTGIYLYDEIGGYGITAASFVAELNAVEGPLTIYVGSRGGDVFDGMSIYSAIAEREDATTAYVDSLAASIASVIVQAADKRIMSPNAMIMIHAAQGQMYGDATEMRAMADLLDKTSDTIAGVYAEKNGDDGDRERFRALMDAETWFNADEALAAGLVDEIGTPTKPADSGAQNRNKLLVANTDQAEKEAAHSALAALQAAFN